MKFTSTLAAVIFLATGVSAMADDSVSTLVNRATNASNLIVDLAGPNVPNDSAVPRELLRDSVCLVSIPGYKKAGFIFGAAYGAGIATCRNANGIYDAPFFVTLVGGSWGLQIGVKSTDLLLVMTEQNARAQLLAGAGFKLGVDASLAVGPLGRDAQAGTNVDFHEKTFSYSNSVGIFGGLSLEGSKLTYDGKAEAVNSSSAEVTSAMSNVETTVNNIISSL